MVKGVIVLQLAVEAVSANGGHGLGIGIPVGGILIGWL
jgi:hypothetical protein